MARFATELSMLILSRIELKYAVPFSSFFSVFFLSSSHFACSGDKIVVRIPEQRLCSGG